MRDWVLVLSIIVVTVMVVVAGSLLFRAFSPPRVMTCSDYSNYPREHVPARCFGDFQPERR